MESSQFETLLSAINGLTADVKDIKLDVSGLKTDVNGLKIQSAQFQSEIGGLKSEVSGIKSDLRRLETKMDAGFAEVRKDLKIVREQVALTHVDVTDLKVRVSRLEGARA